MPEQETSPEIRRHHPRLLHTTNHVTWNHFMSFVLTAEATNAVFFADKTKHSKKIVLYFVIRGVQQKPLVGTIWENKDYI